MSKPSPIAWAIWDTPERIEAHPVIKDGLGQETEADIHQLRQRRSLKKGGKEKMKNKRFLAHLAASFSVVTFCMVSAPNLAAAKDSPSQEGSDPFVSFDQVDAKGTNLRKVLAEHQLIKKVLPLGKRLTFIETENDGALRSDVINSGVEKAFYRLCRTKWQIKDATYDIMTGNASLGWREVSPDELAVTPWLIHTHVVVNPETKTKRRIDGARCDGAFTWEAKTLDMNPVVHVMNIGYIDHETDQPYVWKSDDVPEPTELPPDGIVPTTFFGEKYKEGLLTRGYYPSTLDLLAWANRLCDLRGGHLRMAYQKSEYVGGRWQRRQVVQETLDKILVDLPSDDYYLACEGTGQGFLIRKFKDADKRDRLAFQRGRGLESVGVRQ